jgi:hypothetical protein
MALPAAAFQNGTRLGSAALDYVRLQTVLRLFSIGFPFWCTPFKMK